MKPFREIHAQDLHSYSMDEFRSLGYVLVRGVIPPDDVTRVRAEIVEKIDAGGWLLLGHDPMDCVANPAATCGHPEPDFMRVFGPVLNLESIHSFVHHPALLRLMQHFAGPRVLVHPNFVMRVVFPNCERIRHRIHQDHEGVRGDAECFTVWTPFHDCSVERGALQLMEASHRFGLQSDPAVGHVTRAVAQGGDWVGGQINAGDVLLFHSLTVHEPALNTTSQFRLSIDCRFQDCARDFNPGNLVGWDWDSIYANWRSDEFQYYWKRLPLRFKPSLEELAQLTDVTGPPEMRAKHARVMDLIEHEMAQK